MAVGKGLAKAKSASGTAAGLGGIGSENPYISVGRAGLFDTDYLMHMNNAAYLSHAEYARWEMCAYNGLLSNMYKNNVNFMVGGTAVRFRKEIAPIFRKFEVHSFVARLDERYMWIYHVFRYPPGGKDPGRIRAQAVCQGIAIQGRTVLDPRMYLRDMVGINADAIDALSKTSHDNETEKDVFAVLMDKYAELEVAFKAATALDDALFSKEK